MFPLNTLSVLEFTGHDAGQFLHNQLSADIINIKPGSAGFACCCNPAGRVLGLLLVCPVVDSFYALCASELAEPLQTWLSRFVIRADVKITVRDDLAVLVGASQDSNPDVIQLNTETGLVYSVSPVSDNEAGEVQASVWKANELKAGIIWLDANTSAQYLPQMLGFERIGALSFNKGCYPGQEIIARTRYLGKLKRIPVLVRVNSDFPAEIMAKAELIVGENSFSAVVVDQSLSSATDQYLVLVARMGAETTPERIRIGEQESLITLD